MQGLHSAPLPVLLLACLFIHLSVCVHDYSRIVQVGRACLMGGW